MARIAALLDACRVENQWANRGPLYRRLADAYGVHLGLASDRAVVPCANGGIALEAMARLLALDAGRPLRWVGSAFSFQNLGRGYFAGMTFVDCDARGVQDVEALRGLERDSYNGIIVTNPFGQVQDFAAHIAFAREAGKALLIDNAAGLDRSVPDWPWQSFSLHHTKPYGAGEGGLALVPAEAADRLYQLLDYGVVPDNAASWLNNGKISDIACAFHLDRLERVDDWAPRYRQQAARISRLARHAGLRPLFQTDAPGPPATSLPFLAEGHFGRPALRASRRVTYAKYYKPLAPRPQAQALFERLVNVPTHPDMASLSDDHLAEDLARLAGSALDEGARTG